MTEENIRELNQETQSAWNATAKLWDDRMGRRQQFSSNAGLASDGEFAGAKSRQSRFRDCLSYCQNAIG